MDQGVELSGPHNIPAGRSPISDDVAAWWPVEAAVLADDVPLEALDAILTTLHAMGTIYIPLPGFVGNCVASRDAGIVAAYRQLWADAVALHLATGKVRVQPHLH